MNLINKSDVEAEIWKKLQNLIACKENTSFIENRVVLWAKIDICKEILSFLDTLGVKKMNEVPANVILNQFGNKYISSWSGLKEYDNFQLNEEIKILIPDK